jgi:hypothetical protein
MTLHTRTIAGTQVVMWSRPGAWSERRAHERAALFGSLQVGVPLLVLTLVVALCYARL